MMTELDGRNNLSPRLVRRKENPRRLPSRALAPRR